MTDLDRLLEQARNHEMTTPEREEQRRSFVYGNVRIGNLVITRRLVDEIADEIIAEQISKPEKA